MADNFIWEAARSRFTTGECKLLWSRARRSGPLKCYMDSRLRTEEEERVGEVRLGGGFSQDRPDCRTICLDINLNVLFLGQPDGGGGTVGREWGGTFSERYFFASDFSVVVAECVR